MRGSRIVGVLAAACLTVLVGCSSGPSGTSATPAPAVTPAGSGSFPLTVTGKLGSSTIPAKPTRVVALSWTDGDIALSMGVTPVGTGKVPTTDSGYEPWTEQSLGSAAKPTVLDTTKSDPIEAIAALHPDVILATKDYNLEQSYADLTKIAPVVGYVNGPNADSWQDTTTLIGKALGVPDAAAKAIADTNTAITTAASTHSGFHDKTFSLVVGPTADGFYAVNSNADVSSALLSQLGLTLTPTVTGLPGSAIPGRTQLSYEQIGLVEADVVFATGPPSGLARLKATPGFTALKAVSDGGYVPLEPALAQSIAFPSPISIRWGIENLAPKIATALHQ